MIAYRVWCPGVRTNQVVVYYRSLVRCVQETESLYGRPARLRRISFNYWLIETENEHSWAVEQIEISD